MSTVPRNHTDDNTEDTIHVIDQTYSFFMVDNEIIDEYLSQMGPVAFAVYCVLKRHAQQGGAAFPKYSTIAGKVGRGRRTVIQAIATLENMGLIKRQVRRRADGGQTSNNFAILAVHKRQGRRPVEDLERGATDDTPPVQPTAPPPCNGLHPNKNTQENNTAAVAARGARPHRNKTTSTSPPQAPAAAAGNSLDEDYSRAIVECWGKDFIPADVYPELRKWQDRLTAEQWRESMLDAFRHDKRGHWAYLFRIFERIAGPPKGAMPQGYWGTDADGNEMFFEVVQEVAA